MKLNPQVDTYLQQGCMRCPLGATPECKVNSWTEELKAVRAILLNTGLKEELKWGVPTYTIASKNVIQISALKESCVLSFFKGALMKDAHQLLEKPGENSRHARYIRFTSVEKILACEEPIKDYIRQAMEIEKAGLKVEPLDERTLTYPEELQQKFREAPALKAAFEALTPGRRRGYIIYFSAPKQSKTRMARIEKWTPMMLAGKGMQDDYNTREK